MRDEALSWRTADGSHLHARVWLPAGEAVAAVAVVHGLGEYIGNYTALAEAFTAAGFAVLGIDLRGHGHSPGPRGHAPGFSILLDDLALLHAETARRCPARPLFFFGHSLGGSLVLNYVLRRRPTLAGVVAVAPALRLFTPPPAWKLALARACCRVCPAVTFHNGLDDLKYPPTDPQRHDRISARLGVDLLEYGAWAHARAAEWSLPLLLMLGGDDRIIDPAAVTDFANRVPAPCTLTRWHGFPHELHTSPEREQVFAHTVTWMRSRL